MGAADDIRAGKLAKFQALEDAGLHTHTVEMFVFLEQTQEAKLGKGGEARYNRLTMKPNPEVVFKQKTFATERGFEDKSHVTLKGAFPPSLAGAEVLLTGEGVQTASVPTSKAYATPKDFRADVETAAYFLIDGEKFVFRGGGFLEADKYESFWTLHLLKVEKK